jgi:uncharacterized membrane protein
MNRILLALLVVLVVAAVAIIAGTSGDLPARMATHFGAGGAANGWSTRETYLLVMIGLVIAIPALLLALMVWLPERGLCACKLPNRDYWLAPPRRAGTFERLTGYAGIAGALVVALLVAVHFIVIEANSSTRPALPTGPFVTVMLAFAVAMIAWTVALSYGFRRPL